MVISVFDFRFSIAVYVCALSTASIVRVFRFSIYVFVSFFDFVLRPWGGSRRFFILPVPQCDYF